MINITVTLGITKKTVPLSAFNEGKADEIFAEVKQSGPVIVMNNETPECVIVPMNEYQLMTADHDDIRLIAIADERMSHFDPSKLLTQEEVYESLGITQEEIDAMPEVELE